MEPIVLDHQHVWRTYVNAGRLRGGGVSMVLSSGGDCSISAQRIGTRAGALSSD